MKSILLIVAIVISVGLRAQNYTSYFTGSEVDIVTNPIGGTCLMGGATESDDAMKWFLERCDGGDVLVLRASGSDGYNDYFFSELGIQVNSVETIVCNSPFAETEEYIQDKVSKAEAIWFAGGDQWNYVSYWRNGPLETLINQAISERNIVIGGTSAGMAILGGYYFNAVNGTTTSATALANPFANTVTPDAEPFLNVPLLFDVITDTHFDSPDRRGRMVAFLARIYTDENVYAKGIACDEYTAVCVDENGLAKVYGGYPAEDDIAYFIQVNCANDPMAPETCVAGQSLNWNLNGEALKVYRVKGTTTGSYSFDLSDWQTGNGGEWLHWSVQDGVFIETPGTAIECSNVGIEETSLSDFSISIFPNPNDSGVLHINSNQAIDFLEIRNAVGQIVYVMNKENTAEFKNLELKLASGIYTLSVDSNGVVQTKKFIVQ
jgi:cyanophycinase-like exopeptidase